ncbi:corticotropin-releasing factor-binding protein isoform X2 [Rhodnius prolixus]
MLVTSEEGHYYYKATSDDTTVCGIYLMSPPNRIIEVYFDYLDAPCGSGGLVSFVDGWELNGGYLPGLMEHNLPLKDRITEFCGLTAPTRVFTSTQNAAMIQYRIPKRGRGFSFKVNFLKNLNPCNILVEDDEQVYTVRNYGKASNCSLIALYPIHMALLSISVGVTPSGDHFKIETGTMRKCQETGLKDFMEVSGGMDLLSPKLTQADTFCGIDSYPEGISETVLCGVSTVRLVSSGEYDNMVTLAIRQAKEEELMTASVACPL